MQAAIDAGAGRRPRRPPDPRRPVRPRAGHPRDRRATTSSALPELPRDDDRLRPGGAADDVGVPGAGALGAAARDRRRRPRRGGRAEYAEAAAPDRACSCSRLVRRGDRGGRPRPAPATARARPRSMADVRCAGRAPAAQATRPCTCRRCSSRGPRCATAGATRCAGCARPRRSSPSGGYDRARPPMPHDARRGGRRRCPAGAGRLGGADGAARARRDQPGGRRAQARRGRPPNQEIAAGAVPRRRRPSSGTCRSLFGRTGRRRPGRARPSWPGARRPNWVTQPPNWGCRPSMTPARPRRIADRHADQRPRDRRRRVPPLDRRPRGRSRRLHLQPVPARRRRAAALPHRRPAAVPARVRGGGQGDRRSTAALDQLRPRRVRRVRRDEPVAGRRARQPRSCSTRSAAWCRSTTCATGRPCPSPTRPPSTWAGIGSARSPPRTSRTAGRRR